MRAERLLAGAEHSALRAVLAEVEDLAARGRYENAARLRDHAATAIDALWRGQRLRALVAVDELVAARPDGAGGWHLAVVRHGQLSAAGNAVRGVPPMPVVEAISAGAQTILAMPAPLGGALVEETALIARWLAAPGVRMVRVRTASEDGYASPIGAAGVLAEWSALARSARVAARRVTDEPYDDRYGSSVTPRPRALDVRVS